MNTAMPREPTFRTPQAVSQFRQRATSPSGVAKSARGERRPSPREASARRRRRALGSSVRLGEPWGQRQPRSRRRVRLTDENRTVQVAGDSGWKHHPGRGLVVSALFFFPRGGSAQVTRSLARALPAAGWQPTLAAGSLGQPGEPTHAASFFAGIDVHALDYSPALELTEPLAAPVPFQPSYEDRPDAPDRIFAAVDDAAYERLVAAWIELLARAGAGAADLLHLHHLTPANDERLAFWRRWLVEQPRGWDESGRPGSIAYRDEELAPFRSGGPVFLYVGRYTAVKRLPLLISAHARAIERLGRPAPLVLVGGHPGEWEGEHPLAAARRIGNRQVFLAGWRPHEELPQALNAVDALVLPSVAEAFGLVLVEAMACGVPVIACRAHGPAAIVADGKTGWLIPPDDEDALVDWLVAVATGQQERRARGRRAHTDSRRYGWAEIAPRFASLYEELLASAPKQQVPQSDAGDSGQRAALSP